ncbi:MAG TPA: hypothetical protein VFG50_07040 [Rhodothermales bacterium]|nr:hypothetical protein [Rhodothermales bacterium]
MRTALTFLLLLLPLYTRAQAQNDSPPEHYPYKEWLVLGVGPGTPYDAYFGASYNFGKRHFYQVAFNASAELALFGGLPAYVNAASVSLGKRAAMKYVVAAAFAGPAFVWGRHRVDTDRHFKLFYTAGVNLNGQLYLRPLVDVGTVAGIPLGGIGFGIDLHSNLNPVRSTAGFRLSLYLGTAH